MGLLSLERVRAGYGEAVVLDDVTLQLDDGECVAVLGRNGVGKTTLLATVMGTTRLHSGTIAWRGERIDTLPVHRRARSGIGWVPQDRAVWRSLDVREHLEVVARPGPWTARKAFALFPRLGERRSHRGGELSGGEQQMLAIARALVTNPRLLLLDEPLEGLAPLVVEDVLRVLGELARTGDMAIVLVEQHAGQALSIASRAFLMDRGRIVREARGDALLSDPSWLERSLFVR